MNSLETHKIAVCILRHNMAKTHGTSVKVYLYFPRVFTVGSYHIAQHSDFPTPYRWL